MTTQRDTIASLRLRLRERRLSRSLVPSINPFSLVTPEPRELPEFKPQPVSSNSPDLSRFQKKTRGGFAGLLDKIESPISRTASKAGGGIFKGLDVAFEKLVGEEGLERSFAGFEAIARGDIRAFSPRTSDIRAAQADVFERRLGRPLRPKGAGRTEDILESFGQRHPALQIGGRIVADPLNLLGGVGLVAKPLLATRAGLAARGAAGGAVTRLRTALRPVELGVATEDLAAQSSVKRLAQVLRQSKKLNKEQKAIRRSERARQAIDIQEAQSKVLREGGTSEDFLRIRGVQKGKLFAAQFEESVEQFGVSLDDIRKMNEVIARRSIAEFGVQFDSLNAQYALTSLFNSRRVPTPSEIKLIGKFLGSDLEDALRAASAGKKTNVLLANAADILAFPRAILSAWDWSAPLRQGIVATAAHPFLARKAFRDMARAFVSETFSINSDALLIRRSGAGLAGRAGVFIAQRGATFAQRADPFASRFAATLPGIRMSERAFRSYLNRLRADIFDNVMDEWRRSGKLTHNTVDALDDELKLLGKFVNASTGRGSLFGFESEGLAKVMSATLFSPRLLTSRIQLPVEFVKAVMRDPAGAARGIFLGQGQTASQIIARDVARFVGVTVGTTSGLSFVPGVDITLDPRSSDFGKVKVGNTRVDMFGGFQQIASLTARLSFGEIARLGTGERFDADQISVATRFLRSKLSPALGLVTDTLTGETFLGEDFQPTEGRVSAGQFFERLAPLFLQDLVDAINTDGIIGAGVAAPGFLGANIGSFQSTGDALEQVAQEEFNGESYANLNIVDQQRVRNDPRVMAVREQANLSRASEVAGEARQEFDAKMVAVMDRDGVDMAGNPTTSGQVRTAIGDLRFKNAIFQQAVNEVMDRFRDTQAKPDEGTIDRAIVDYFELFSKDILDGGVIDYADRVDFDVLDQRLEAFGWSDKQREAIDTFIVEGLPPELQDFMRHRKELRNRGWFGAYEQAPEFQALSPAWREIFTEGLSAKDNGVLAEWAFERGGTRTAELRQFVNSYESLADDVRVSMRAKDRDLDFTVWRWEGDAPVLPSTQVRAVNFLRENGFTGEGGEFAILERVMVSKAGSHLDDDIVVGLASAGISSIDHLAGADPRQLARLRDARGQRLMSSSGWAALVQQAKTLVAGVGAA